MRRPLLAFLSLALLLTILNTYPHVDAGTYPIVRVNGTNGTSPTPPPRGYIWREYLLPLLRRIGESIAVFFLRVLGTTVLIILAIVSARFLRNFLWNSLKRSKKIEETVAQLIANLIYYTYLSVFVLAILTVIGIETTSVVALLGALSIAVSLALQGTLSNFASGIMLVFFRPFAVGEWVEVSSVSGFVAEIGAFACTLNTLENVAITVPNANIWGQVIKNYSSNHERRVDLVIPINLLDDVDAAIHAIEGVINQEPRILHQPPPLVVTWEIGEFSLNLSVRCWVRTSDYWKVRAALLKRIKPALEEVGCAPPFPQRDLHLRSVPLSMMSGPAAPRGMLLRGRAMMAQSPLTGMPDGVGF